MQSQSTLVRPQSRVELDSVASVHCERPIVTLPGHSEGNDPFWDLDYFESSSVFRLLREKLRCSVKHHRSGER